jgi:hypothetical protein
MPVDVGLLVSGLVTPGPLRGTSDDPVRASVARQVVRLMYMFPLSVVGGLS